MLMLLLLTNIFIPLEVTNWIIGPKVALIPFDYIPFKSFSLSSKINEIFGFDQINTNIVEIGLESGSSFVNNFSLLCFLIWIIALHFMLNIIVWWFKRWNSSRIISKIIKAPNFIVKKLLIILTFHYYIRTFLESSLTLQVSSISEIYYFSTGSRAKRSSLVCAVLVLILLISFLFVSFFLSITIKIEEGISNVLEELFRGLKNHWRFRFYTPIVITRRFIFILLLIIYAPVSPFYASWILWIVQLIYTILISIMRPFESRKDNLIEIINELFFLVFLCWIWASYSKTNWTLTQSNTFIFLILSNNFILLIIVLSKTMLFKLNSFKHNFCINKNKKFLKEV